MQDTGSFFYKILAFFISALAGMIICGTVNINAASKENGKDVRVNSVKPHTTKVA